MRQCASSSEAREQAQRCTVPSSAGRSKASVRGAFQGNRLLDSEFCHCGWGWGVALAQKSGSMLVGAVPSWRHQQETVNCCNKQGRCRSFSCWVLVVVLAAPLRRWLPQACRSSQAEPEYAFLFSSRSHHELPRLSPASRWLPASCTR